MANTRCCQAEDARHCIRQAPGTHGTSSEQRPDIFVPHYQNDCSCFSCRWVRETFCPFILSNMEHTRLPYPVVNPTHNRVQPQERQRLLTPVAKKRFQIMYIYAMQLEDGKWGWVVVLPTPLLPFLITDDSSFGVATVARHPVHGWFGLKSDGHHVQIGHERSPPLYNPLYQHYGYDPQCSPYRRYQQPHEEKTVDDKSHPSSGDDTNPSSQSPDISSTKAMPSTQGTTASTSPASKIGPSLATQAAPTVMDNVTSAFDRLAKISSEAHATLGASSQSSAHVPATGNDKRSENPEWVVVDPRWANPPVSPGDGDYRYYHRSPVGKYNCQQHYNRHTDRANTTIFVGGLAKKMTQEDLHYWFEGFGELLYVRKKVDQTCGFVQYPSRRDAEMAMSQMQGFPVHGARLRLSWGSPVKLIDQKYWEYYEASAQEAYKGWEAFDGRMFRGEARREDDPSFW